jgi:anti-anti-sigma factor
VTVIDVAGSYSRRTFLSLLEVARTCLAGGGSTLLVNMANLPHINSEGIGLLVLIHDECETAGGAMALCNVPGTVGHVLKLAGVLRFFNTYPDEASGVAALGRPAGATAAGTGARGRAPASLPGPAAPRRGTAPAAGDAAPGGSGLRPSGEPPGPDPRRLAEAAHEVVRTIIRGRQHHQVVEFFAGRPGRAASLEEIASGADLPRLTAELVMRDLARSGVVAEEGGRFEWRPSEEMRRKLELFRGALAEPELRSRLLAWLYAEEKR